MGAGKSSIGRLLATLLQQAFVDLDDCVEAEAGTTITSIFAAEGEQGFRTRESRALSDALANAASSVIATGGGAIVDPDNRAAMRGASIVIYLQVESAAQLHRLKGDDTRPLLVNADRAQRLSALQVVREPLYREVADLVLDTTQLSPEYAATTLAAMLRKSSECCA